MLQNVDVGRRHLDAYWPVVGEATESTLMIT